MKRDGRRDGKTSIRQDEKTRRQEYEKTKTRRNYEKINDEAKRNETRKGEMSRCVRSVIACLARFLSSSSLLSCLSISQDCCPSDAVGSGANSAGRRLFYRIVFESSPGDGARHGSRTRGAWQISEERKLLEDCYCSDFPLSFSCLFV